MILCAKAAVPSYLGNRNGFRKVGNQTWASLRELFTSVKVVERSSHLMSGNFASAMARETPPD